MTTDELAAARARIAELEQAIRRMLAESGYTWDDYMYPYSHREERDVFLTLSDLEGLWTALHPDEAAAVRRVRDTGDRDDAFWAVFEACQAAASTDQEALRQEGTDR